MTGINHIAGGVVITGFLSSFLDLNIFEKPEYIGATILFSLLPDIDTTKSIIGKICYPISRILYKKYGHRTLTHSLLFYIVLGIIISILDKVYTGNFNITLIYLFAYGSHLFLDMITISGVPLFYPFANNQCVLPANENYRIHSGNIKQEGIAFFTFALFLFGFQDLFANGFWTSLNNQFNDFKFIEYEYNNSKTTDSLIYNYDYLGKNYNGKALLVYADDKKIIIYEKGQYKEISNEPLKQISTLKIKKSTYAKGYRTTDFENINIDSLNKIIKDKFIFSGEIYSQKDFYYNKKKIKEHKFTNELGKRFHITDSLDDKIKSYNDNLEDKINLILERQKMLENEESIMMNEYLNKAGELSHMEHIARTSRDLFTKNEAQKRIIELRKELKHKNKSSRNMINFYNLQIEQLQKKYKILNDQFDAIKFTGNFTYLDK